MGKTTSDLLRFGIFSSLGQAAFYEQSGLDEPAPYDLATRIMTDNAQRADAEEGIQAFLQKRRPTSAED